MTNPATLYLVLIIGTAIVGAAYAFWKAQRNHRARMEEHQRKADEFVDQFKSLHRE